MLAGFILFLAYFFFIYKPLYNTQVKLYIKNIPQNDIIANYNKSLPIQSESGFSNPFYNLIQIMKSDKLSSNLYDYLSAKHPEDLKKYGYTTKDKFKKSFPNNIKVSIEPSTDIMNVNLNWINKNTTIELLGELISEFKYINLDIKKTGDAKQREYLEQQINLLGTQLDDVRNQIRDYKVENQTMDAKDESLNVSRTRLDIEKQIEIIKSKIGSAELKIGELKNQLDVKDAKSALKSASVGEDPYIVKLNADLSVAQQALAKLQSEFTDEYPEIIRVKSEISQIKQNIQSRMTETLKNYKVEKIIYDTPSLSIVTDLARVQSEKTALIGELNGLTQSVKDLKEKESKLPGQIAGIEYLEKQETALAHAYLNGRQKLMEAVIKENQIVDNIIPLGEPTTPKAGLKKIFIKFVGFIMLGFLGAYAYLWIKDEFEDKWFDTAEIEDLTGKKIIGVIPWIKFFGSEAIANKNKTDSILDLSFKNIANSIIRRSYAEEARALSFLSTSDKRRKSSFIPVIAHKIARTGTSIVLIDTDFSAALNEKDKKRMGIDNLPFVGIIDLIDWLNKALRNSAQIEEEQIESMINQCLTKISAGGPDFSYSLDYISSPREVEDLHDYVSTTGFKMLINYLKKKYDFVLIDIPSKPAFFPEIQCLTDISDAVVIICSLETNKNKLITMVKNLDEAGKKVLGIIPREENTEIEKYFTEVSVNNDEYNDTETKPEALTV